MRAIAPSVENDHQIGMYIYVLTHVSGQVWLQLTQSHFGYIILSGWTNIRNKDSA